MTISEAFLLVCQFVPDLVYFICRSMVGGHILTGLRASSAGFRASTPAPIGRIDALAVSCAARADRLTDATSQVAHIRLSKHEVRTDLTNRRAIHKQTQMLETLMSTSMAQAIGDTLRGRFEAIEAVGHAFLYIALRDGYAFMSHGWHGGPPFDQH